MKATESNFLKFIQGPKQFVIPIYQRNYSWTPKQCEQLWNDIVRAGMHDEVQGHFIGSIVYIQSGIYQSSTISELLVIDGQQRLATLSLLLKALAEALDVSKIEGTINGKKIINYYLLNNEEINDLQHKLLLTSTDKDTIVSLIEGREIPSEYSYQIIRNYKFFQEQIQKNAIDLSKLYDGINKLFIVDISLEREKDNPQLIFESLNSTGLRLSEADLIRNYVLMSLEPNEQQKIYNQYWLPMEKDFEQKDYTDYFNRFMRDFLTLKIGRIPNMREVYSEFKSYMISNKSKPIYETVKEIRDYSRLFVKLAYAREENPQLRQVINDINELEVEVSYPFLMQVFDDCSKNTISTNDKYYIMRLVESYVFRRAICQIPTASLNKTFANLIKEIDKNRYVESIKSALVLQQSYKRFPADEEFKNRFIDMPLYTRRITDYALRKLENRHHEKEPIVVEHYTMEHIIPQNPELSKAWIDELGSDWKQIQEKYGHTIGNLTLTGYNSELGDRSFIEKRDMKGGFASSPIWLNKGIGSLDHWNKDEIEKRANSLADIAVEIWAMPRISQTELERYKKSEESEVSSPYTEEDHFEISSQYSRTLYETLKPAILSMANDIYVVPKKKYIAFVHKRNFVDIVFYRSQLNLYLNMKKGTLHDPGGLANDVSPPGHGHWGNGDYVVFLKHINNVDGILSLIQQSYDEN